VISGDDSHEFDTDSLHAGQGRDPATGAPRIYRHPASTTHQRFSDEETQASGVTDDLVRLAVGIENPAPIVADLDRAIEEATPH
jgi:O-acetylhomoserine/O-acetylserine sulfhydrylase-like pyridoxal-dependent enzyme